MRQQLAQLVESLSFESAVLVDVGGDVLATGTEAELRSRSLIHYHSQRWRTSLFRSTLQSRDQD